MVIKFDKFKNTNGHTSKKDDADNSKVPNLKKQFIVNQLEHLQSENERLIEDLEKYKTFFRHHSESQNLNDLSYKRMLIQNLTYNREVKFVELPEQIISWSNKFLLMLLILFLVAGSFFDQLFG